MRGRGIRTYLVESLKGELLFVKRILKRKDDEFQDVTSKFEVFKLIVPDSLNNSHQQRSLR